MVLGDEESGVIWIQMFVSPLLLLPYSYTVFSKSILSLPPNYPYSFPNITILPLPFLPLLQSSNSSPKSLFHTIPLIFPLFTFPPPPLHFPSQSLKITIIILTCRRSCTHLRIALAQSNNIVK